MTQVKLPSRVADYFLVVGTDTGKPKENLHDKRANQKVVFEAKVLERFPPTDYKDAEFPRDVQMFCFPFGLILSSTSVGESHNFILTEQDGTRLFGSCYTFYEEYAPESKGDHKMYVPKALAVVSHWPFLHQFNRFLSQLYKVVSKSAEIRFPLERAIANFILEIPLPPPGRLEVECKSLGQQLFRRPPPNKMPLRDFNLNDLFRCLSVDNILLLYAAVLAERRVLLVSSKLKRLTIAAESICYLLFPMFWRHIYIPVLPIQLIDFVCAPMPFLVGVHSSYLPDELMLDQVVVVELDKNAIRQSADDPIAPLSDRALAHFNRGLKKLVGDTTTPIKQNQTLNEDTIEQIFLGNMARMLSRYRDYLEAPSEFVIDKFNKTKFVAEHDEKNKFLSDFMETQMFQCFVDDRYDSVQHRGNNLEVLFFDESIDAANGKPTPFITDTSHAHQASAKVIALSPNVEGLPKGKIFKYTTFPPKLQPDLFYPVREIKALTDEKVQNKVDMSKLNMKFFTEKRLYSQHFHSLRLRSSKQDLAFKDVMGYLKRSQEHDETFTSAFDRMCALTIDRDTIETGTTIDGAWGNLKKLVARQSVLEAAAFKRIRDECWRPLDGVASSAEHQLKILFQEANILEQKAGHCKAIVERAKAKSNVMQLKYENLKNQLSSAGSLSTSDIHRIVQTQSEAEDAALQLDETETGFQTIVQEYETRMPEIIKTIRRLNTERIEQFKYSMEQWTSQKREVLNGMIKSLDSLTEAVKSINAQKDLVSFSEGSTDFWNIGRLGGDTKAGQGQTETTSPIVMEVSEAELLNPTPSTQPMSTSSAAGSTSTTPSTIIESRERLPASPPPPPQPSAVASTLKLAPNAPLSYTINLWAGNGFQTAYDQATITKHAVKELIHCLQEWSLVQDAKSKKLAALQKSAENLPQQTTERNLWMAIRNRTNIQSKAYNDMQLVLSKLASDLRVTKGELKHSMRRFADHKASLEKELKDANDVLMKAHDKRVRARMAFTTVENISRQSVLKSTTVAVATVVKETDKLDKASREFKEAEQLYILAERDRQAKQVKHDVCLARILRLFEKKEKQCGNHLKMALSVVMDCCQNYLHTAFVAGDEQVMTSLRKVDVETDLKAFVESTYDANTPPHLKLADGERVDLAKHMGLAGFDTASNILSRGVVSIKGLTQYLDDHVLIDDQEMKMMRRVTFKVKSCTFGTLGTAYAQWDAAMDKIQTVFEMEMKNLKSSVAPLLSLRHSLKASIKSQEKTYTELERVYRRAQEENDKAHQDELRAQQALTQARAKVQQAQDEAKAAATDSKRKASLFSRFGSTPLDKLQSAETNAKKELEAARLTLQRKQAALQEAIDQRSSGIEKLLAKIRVIEEGRFVSLRDAMSKMLELHQGSLTELQRLIISVTDKVKLVNLDADIQSFLAAKNTNIKPPDCVIEDHIRASGVETKQRAADKEREKARATKAGSLAPNSPVNATSPTAAASASSPLTKATTSTITTPSGDHKDAKSPSTSTTTTSITDTKKDDTMSPKGDEKKSASTSPASVTSVTESPAGPRSRRERGAGGTGGRRASRFQPVSNDKPNLPPGSKPKPPRRPPPPPQPQSSPSHAAAAAAAAAQPNASMSSSAAGSTSTTAEATSTTPTTMTPSSSASSIRDEKSTVVLGELGSVITSVTDDEVIEFGLTSPTGAASAENSTNGMESKTIRIPRDSDDSDEDSTNKRGSDDIPIVSAPLIRVTSADSDSDSDDERSTSRGSGLGTASGSGNGSSSKKSRGVRATAAELFEMSPELRRPRKSAYEDSDDEKDEENPNVNSERKSILLSPEQLPRPPQPPASSSSSSTDVLASTPVRPITPDSLLSTSPAATTGRVGTPSASPLSGPVASPSSPPPPTFTSVYPESTPSSTSSSHLPVTPTPLPSSPPSASDVSSTTPLLSDPSIGTPTPTTAVAAESLPSPSD